MTAKHTPGPWHIEIRDGKVNGTDYSYVPEAFIKSEQKGRYASIASVRLASIGYSGTKQDRAHDEANARLIAAAPELLAALELALRYLENPEVQAIPFALPANAAVERARAAIAKTTA